MEKLIEKILSMRGPDFRPFAIEISEDEIRLAVYGGASGFDEPSTAETASYADLGSCLLEGIELLEHSRLLSPSRIPYHRLPRHRCVFKRTFGRAGRTITVRRRALMAVVPRIGDTVCFESKNTELEYEVTGVMWDLADGEAILWTIEKCTEDFDMDRLLNLFLERGWELESERDLKGQS